MDFINSVSTRYGECKLCPEFATCSQSATGRRLQSDEDFEARELRWLAVRPGYWRSSQVSITTERCDDYYVCIGSGSSTTQAEWLCAPGHTGPLCASCKPYHYRSNTNLCTECDNRTRTQGLAAFVHVLDMGATQTWLPIMLLLGVAGIVVSFSLLAVLWMCLSSSVASLPIRLFAMCCCACGIKTGTKIASLASQAAVIMPKIKYARARTPRCGPMCLFRARLAAQIGACSRGVARRSQDHHLDDAGAGRACATGSPQERLRITHCRLRCTSCGDAPLEQLCPTT